MSRVPGGVQTYSKARYGPGAPGLTVMARGGYIWDDRGHGWIDYVSGLGPVILGHCDPDVDAAACGQIAAGICLPTATALEEQLAEVLAGLVPGAEMARFAKNGADACAAAVRLARAVTGRDHIVNVGYHGWNDWCLADPALGVPGCVRALRTDVPYGDLAALEAAMTWAPSCLILEPVTTAQPMERPPTGYLEACRELCDRTGALLIYDEVVTGFRVALGGAQEAWGAPTPDLICLGKAMGNGYPISALVGRAEHMRRLQSGDVFFSTTFGGDALGLAAALATLHKLKRLNVPSILGARGRQLMAEYERLGREHGLAGLTRIVGYPQRPVWRWDNPTEAATFRAALFKCRVLSPGYHNLSLAHDDHTLAETTSAYRRGFEAVASRAQRAA